MGACFLATSCRLVGPTDRCFTPSVHSFTHVPTAHDKNSSNRCSDGENADYLARPLPRSPPVNLPSGSLERKARLGSARMLKMSRARKQMYVRTYISASTALLKASRISSQAEVSHVRRGVGGGNIVFFRSTRCRSWTVAFQAELQ
ncbi:unnamed protein product, partial [Ectocarpus sp. 13 AM-2016]